jgi:hypothetical protein
MSEMKKSTGEPKLASIASWAVLGASFGLSASTWIALAKLAGFTDTLSLYVVQVSLAWLMPVAVDGYVMVALVLWMAPVPARVAAFAKTNTYVAASIGVAAQSAYHALSVWTGTGTGWRAGMAAVVGAMPPAVAALAVHMRALIRRESAPATVAAPAPLPVPAPVEMPSALPSVAPAAPVPAPVAEPAAAPVAGKRPSKRQPSAAERVSAAIARSPKASDATIASRLGLSEATVKRHRRQAVDSVSTTHPTPAPAPAPLPAVA